MSKRIGEVNPSGAYADVHVWASRGGVELTIEPSLTLEPEKAEELITLLTQGVAEVRRMRALPEAAP